MALPSPSTALADLVQGPPGRTRTPARSDPVTDGRVARGERTRRAIAEAMINLLQAGDEVPTARRIAEQAGVSLRLVFHHFEDVESILKAAVSVQAERHWRQVVPVRSSLELSTRVRTLVRQRAGLYEAIAPVRRASANLARTSPTISTQLAAAHGFLRDQLEKTFEPELANAGPGARRRMLDALDTATSFEAWDGLVTTGRSPDETRRVLELLVTGALRTRPPANSRNKTDDKSKTNAHTKTQRSGA